MANVVYMSKTGLTGGEATKLDSIDGAGLTLGDVAFVTVSNVQYIYKWAASVAAESSPDIIAADANGGNNRWLLQGVYKGVGHPSFSASVGPAIENATGDNTVVELTGAGIWNEALDNGACLSNGLFTAPVDGLYLLTISWELNSITGDHTGIHFYLSLGGVHLRSDHVDPGVALSGDLYHQQTSLLYMTASQQVNPAVTVYGTSKIVDIGTKTYFNGLRLA